MSFTEKNPKWFYSIEETPELKILEDNYHTILEELNQLRKNSENGYWLDTFPTYLHPDSKNKWKVFTFQFFGIKHPLNAKACPKTYAILQQIPSLVSADFSYLPAHTKILPHKGFSRMVLRAHLGLIVPENCFIRVGEETHTWKEGKMLIFDDSFDHEAWNDSDEDRFVLMLDIASPNWEYSAKDICKYKIDHLEDKFMLSLFPKEKWLHFSEKGEFDVFPSTM
ncbi:MAG TPA: aspartyl/asparaginyl beta-hydroxylase domain-containing protein [Bacteroidia bacterium]|nr:aspartyl/asparaginyl beta-hydroxylase domain-containing protein [Bacteroidia bacterium]